jgi:tRNA pseudouridine55 synthase
MLPPLNWEQQPLPTIWKPMKTIGMILCTYPGSCLNRYWKVLREKHEQEPPVFSAVKVNGKRAFDYARKGEDVKLQPKKIVIHKIEVVSFDLPFAVVRIVCSKGTYVRALARDIGEKLKCGAYLTGLRRTRIGEFNVDDAVSINYFMKNIDDYVTK